MFKMLKISQISKMPRISQASQGRLAAMALLAGVCTAQAAGAPAGKPLEASPAVASPIAAQAMMLGAAWAGPRTVAVGDQGIVMLSDDRGATSRQARSVPVSSTLTAVAFADARHGWAVGHWGAIIATTDGGETWTLQRLAANEDRPLFSVYFFDAQHGVAVGLWSLVLTTDDGGAHWTQQTLSPPPGAAKADANLLQLFADARGTLFAAAERGLVLRSDDKGHSWSYLSTGYKGSFWTGAALSDGTLLVGGQRGTVYRSTDDGKTWARSALDSTSSVTGFAQNKDVVFVVGLDGLRGSSKDSGEHFTVSVRPDRLSLTAALSSGAGSWLTWSRRGAVSDAVR